MHTKVFQTLHLKSLPLYWKQQKQYIIALNWTGK